MGWFWSSQEYDFSNFDLKNFSCIKNADRNDNNYKTGTLDFVKNEVLTYCFRNRKFSYDYDSDKPLNKNFVKGGGWDCNRFSLEFQYNALAFAWGEYDISLPVAMVKYKKDNGGWHMINAIFTTDCFLVYIEPQTCEIIELSENELKTIKYHRF